MRSLRERFLGSDSCQRDPTCPCRMTGQLLFEAREEVHPTPSRVHAYYRAPAQKYSVALTLGQCPCSRRGKPIWFFRLDRFSTSYQLLGGFGPGVTAE